MHERGKKKRMRAGLVVAVVLLMFVTSAEVSSIQGQIPQLPPVTDGIPGNDFTQRILEKGGLLAVVLVLFYFYRRDFLNKNEKDVADKQASIDALKEDKRMLAALVDRSTDALTKHSLALQDNTNVTRQLASNVQTATDVTRTLAANVDKLADRRCLPRDSQ